MAPQPKPSSSELRSQLEALIPPGTIVQALAVVGIVAVAVLRGVGWLDDATAIAVSATLVGLLGADAHVRANRSKNIDKIVSAAWHLMDAGLSDVSGVPAEPPQVPEGMRRSA